MTVSLAGSLAGPASVAARCEETVMIEVQLASYHSEENNAKKSLVTQYESEQNILFVHA